MAPHHHHHLLSNIHVPHIKASDIDILGDWEQWDSNIERVGKVFGDSIPGYRYSATFLTTLRSNLHLARSPPPSAMSTPTGPSFSNPLTNPSPLSISQTASTSRDSPPPSDPLASLPPLTTRPATPPEIIPALKLIADSVAQQRQAASKALILHPATIAFAFGVLAVLARVLETTVLITTAAGLVMAMLVAIRGWTSGYITEAETIGFRWLQGDAAGPPSSSSTAIFSSSSSLASTTAAGGGHKKNGSGAGKEEPIVLVTQWGDEIIGTVVVRFVKRERKGYVRAWTVGRKFRGKGVGRGLLEEGVRVVWGRGGRGVEFEGGHANSYRALPEFFNGKMDKNDRKAREVLAEVLAEQRREKSSR